MEGGIELFPVEEIATQSRGVGKLTPIAAAHRGVFQDIVAGFDHGETALVVVMDEDCTAAWKVR